MRYTLILVALLGCSGHHGTTTTTPPPDPPATETCGGETCTAPARCITVVGMQPGSAHDECWITCGEDETCPAGLTCTMMYDGPGQVCVKPE